MLYTERAIPIRRDVRIRTQSSWRLLLSQEITSTNLRSLSSNRLPEKQRQTGVSRTDSATCESLRLQAEEGMEKGEGGGGREEVKKSRRDVIMGANY